MVGRALLYQTTVWQSLGRPPIVDGVLHHLDYRLAYSECDPAGIVYFGAYHPWMERVHTDWTCLQGLRTDEMLSSHHVTTVSRHSAVTYEHPARLFDAIRCSMRLDRLGASSYTSRFDFVRRDDDRLLAVGTMTMVFVGPSFEPTRVPGWMREHLLAAGAPLTTGS
jgi:YbgC/YbaW family acyl-CoA thioester hydrolase